MNRNLVSPGDRVYFWISGSDARLVAVGTVTSPVYHREESQFGKSAVDVSYEWSVEPPLTREELHSATSAVLRGFKPFFGFMGTNYRIADPEVVVAIDEALKGRLMAPTSSTRVADSSVSIKTRDLQIELDRAIKHANHQAAVELKQRISGMDPIAFEWLIRALLIALEYTDIKVTKPSNDGGVDLRATLEAGGIANIQTAVQVKRSPSVNRPVVQALRGSLSAHESGLLVTSGRFTEGAEDEARDVTKSAIALLNGDRLVNLLLERQIGAKERPYKAYIVDPASLEVEPLKAIGELSVGGTQDDSN